MNQCIYNAFNQLTRVTSPGVTIDYTYRADGLRHSSTINGVRTYYVWKNGHIVLELNASRAVTNRLYRCVTGRLIRSSRDGFFLHNARGDVIQRTDASGNVIARYEYDAFGVQRNATNSQNRFRFAGEQFCTHTEMYYLRARDFSPRLGRFTQPDPHWTLENMIFGDEPRIMNERTDHFGRNLYTMVPDAWAIMQAGNLYVYCINNPVMFIDPSGRVIIKAALAVGALVVYSRTPGARHATAAGAGFTRATTGTSGGRAPLATAQGRSTTPAQVAPRNAGAPIGTPGSTNAGAGTRVSTGPQTATPVTRNTLTTNPIQLSHMFKNSDGHFTQDTTSNRHFILNTANRPQNYLGTDSFGNQIFAQMRSDGSQVWTRVRDGVITEAGINQTPRTFHPVTGLNEPPRSR